MHIKVVEKNIEHNHDDDYNGQDNDHSIDDNDKKMMSMIILAIVIPSLALS